MTPARIRTVPNIVCALSLLCLGLVPLAGHALPVVNVWNGLASPDYQNATNIAQVLVFTNWTITADNAVHYLETVNLATSPAGAAVFGLTNNAPLTTIDGDITLGSGKFIVNSQHLDLSGSFVSTVWGTALATRLDGTALIVNVLSNAADLQQALWLTQSSSGVSTINAAFGTAAGLSFDFDTVMNLSGGLLSGAVAMNNAGSGLLLSGYGFELDTGSGFASIGNGGIAALSGQLKGFLESGDSFNISFTQGLAGQISVQGAVVPLPVPLVLLGSALAVLGGFRRRQA